MSATILDENQWRVVTAILEAYIPPLEPHELGDTLSSLDETARASHAQKTSPHLPLSRSIVQASLRPIAPKKLALFKLVTAVLSRRVLALPLTGTYQLVWDMSLADRTKLIQSWRDSRIPQFQQLYRSFLDLALVTFGSDISVCHDLNYQCPDPNVESFKELPYFKVPIVEIPANTGSSRPFTLDTDVVIVGSGSGAAVAAHRLAKDGYRVLILEKGFQVSPEQLSVGDFEADRHAYEAENRLLTDDNSLNVMAASTLGGGPAVNWSCSLRTPQPIRQQYADAGVPWYTSTLYDDALDYIWQAMGTTVDVGPHSFTNDMILKAAKKLEYPAKATGQNTGTHPPNTKYIGYGHRYGEKGGVVNWLYEAIQAGAQVLDNAQVLRIRHRHGKASGVDVLVDGDKRVVVNAKRVVVSAGSLNTPGLLVRSGFSNRHIGRGLKLHPVTLVYGEFDEVVNKHDDTIMTSVCTQTDNLDGKYHGPKIEAMLHTPTIFFKFLPWRNGQDYRQELARYPHLSGLLIITRDKSEGRVYVDKSNPTRVNIDYTTNTYDLWALHQGCLAGANMLYIQGAKRIIFPLAAVPDFVSYVPEASRRLNDIDYQTWYKQAEKAVFTRFKIGLGSAHQMASCRMSDRGSRHAAVDARGRLYECPNVHVIDGSVLPDASGVNPMITIMATAHVLSGFLVDDLRKARL